MSALLSRTEPLCCCRAGNRLCFFFFVSLVVKHQKTQNSDDARSVCLFVCARGRRQPTLRAVAKRGNLPPQLPKITTVHQPAAHLALYKKDRHHLLASNTLSKLHSSVAKASKSAGKVNYRLTHKPCLTVHAPIWNMANNRKRKTAHESGHRLPFFPSSVSIITHTY